MKKFEIKNIAPINGWYRTTRFQNLPGSLKNKKFNYQMTTKGLSDPTGDPIEVQLLHKMEKWLKSYHKEKING